MIPPRFLFLFDHHFKFTRCVLRAVFSRGVLDYGAGAPILARRGCGEAVPVVGAIF